MYTAAFIVRKMNVVSLVFLLCLIKTSHQWCTSTVGVTTCGNEILKKNTPLKVVDYKHLLEFEKGYLEEVPAGSFKLLPDVNIIQLSNNVIKKLEEGSFDGLPQLQKLSLYNNQLESIKYGVFRKCINLKTLNLGLNKISSIESDAFVDLTSLEELNLGFNNLKSVPGEINKVKSLLTLKLNNNKINSVAANTFNNLNKLIVLDLSDNEIRGIANNAFSGLYNLKELNLKSNYLTNLNVDNILSDLRSLTTVKLSINSFTCQTLNSVINTFERKSVSVAKGFSKSGDTVNGIGCKRI